MKTGIKMKVTPEQSAKVQDIVFANGGEWTPTGIGSSKTLIQTSDFFDEIYIDDDSIMFWDNSYDFVDTDLFIRTNGTCIEETHSEVTPTYKLDYKIGESYYDLTCTTFKEIEDRIKDVCKVTNNQLRHVEIWITFPEGDEQ
jgi:hypothetical protein